MLIQRKEITKAAGAELEARGSAASAELQLGLSSAIYSGWVEHTRHQPRNHYFKYPVFMMYLDLDEIDQVFAKSAFWSLSSRFAPASFNRDDYLGDPKVPLKKAVQDCIYEQTGESFRGSVRLLTNVRYFSYLINPISCYYCFDKTQGLKYVIAEVTNTPWGERVNYVLKLEGGNNQLMCEFQKEMHVSPFNPMNMTYRWHSNTPNKKVYVNLDVLKEGSVVMEANVSLAREEISASSLNKILIRFPLMTVKVAIGIHWQALKLLIKRVPVFKHPQKLGAKDKVS